jgi:flagellar biosynthesis protein FlhF
VMAAGGDAREMGETAAAFRRLGVKRLIVTRLDAARRLGGLIGAADAGLTVAQISMSPYVADALVTINSVSLSRLLLSRADAKNAEMEAVSA